MFWHADNEILCVVHGHDFAVLERQSEPDWFWKIVSEIFESKNRRRVGSGLSDRTEMRTLNRKVTWTRESVQYEADQRHVKVCLKEMGVDGESREANTPVDRSSQDACNRGHVVNSEKEEELLSSSGATKYRGTLNA